MSKPKNTRGGARPGSGRKPLPAGAKKVQVSVTLSPQGRADLERLREQGIDINAAMEDYIHEIANNQNKED